MRQRLIKAGLVMAFALANIYCFGSNNDSLFAVWDNSSNDPEIRLTAGLEYSRNILFERPEESRNIALKQIEMAENLDDKKWLVEAHSTIGGSYWTESDYIKALNSYSEALKVANANDLEGMIASCNNNVGTVYDVLGNYPKALEHYEESLKTRLKLDDKQGLAISYSNIGDIYATQNKPEEALEYYNKSLAIDQEFQNRAGIGHTYNSMGMAQGNLGDDDKAKRYYNQSLEIYKELQDERGMATSLNNLGNLFQRTGQHNEAIKNYKECLKLQEKTADYTGMAISQTNIGKSYIARKEYDKAIKSCEKSYDLSEGRQLLVQWHSACECLYKAHNRKKNTSYALAYLERLLMLNKEMASDQTADMLQQLEYTQQLQIQEINFANQQAADSIRAEEARLKTELEAKEQIDKSKDIRNYTMIAGLVILLIASGLFMQLRIVRKSRKIIRKEKDRSEKLLLNILPEEIAQELKEKGYADAKNHEKVTILFTDFKEFTQTSEKLTATELVMEINSCFEAFDLIMERHRIEKIKTIGDAYMAAGGLPIPESGSVSSTVQAALEMQYFITERKKRLDREGKIGFEMRVGIHTGSAVAGIVGVRKFQYDIWGDTVNTAARMESSGTVGRVNVSASTYEILSDDDMFEFEHRGKIEAKNKGAIDMYFVKFHEGYIPDLSFIITEEENLLS